MLSAFMLELLVVLQDNDTGTGIKPNRFARDINEISPENTSVLSVAIPSLRNHILSSLNATEEDVNSDLEYELDMFLEDVLDQLSCNAGQTDFNELDEGTLTSCVETELFPMDWNHPTLVSKSLYSLAIILAFLRLSSIIVINDVIGPLQISLGGMTTDIISFGCIFSVVWLAFAIGINQLLLPFQKVELLICQQENEDDSCVAGPFST
ncbi:short transient receptor potential channel 7-like [Anneissia japonica]|uniref:short transient receptor potential channel 7-like n=1 Tax=Anneissia japonica TaxID=1529436 RepID=UPI001425A5AE|nr:short transient receptor potential channel 7-like [Anneissia japonica]